MFGVLKETLASSGACTHGTARVREAGEAKRLFVPGDSQPLAQWLLPGRPDVSARKHAQSKAMVNNWLGIGIWSRKYK